MDPLIKKADRARKRPPKDVLILREAVTVELAHLELEINVTRHSERVAQLQRRAMRLRTALTSTGGFA